MRSVARSSGTGEPKSLLACLAISLTVVADARPRREMMERPQAPRTMLLLLMMPATRAMSIQMSIQTASGFIPPIGPFCPFKSTVCADNGPLGTKITGLTEIDMPTFAAEMARLQLTMQSGGEPDVGRVRKLADDLDRALGSWDESLQRMRLSTDFQALEYFKLTCAYAESQGESLDSIGLMMRWQCDNMKAFASGMPPLPPPAGLDLGKMMQQQQTQGGQASPMAQMSAADAMTATPFTGDEAAFESDVVKSEYEALCRDHAATIRLGESYGSFVRRRSPHNARAAGTREMLARAPSQHARPRSRAATVHADFPVALSGPAW